MMNLPYLPRRARGLMILGICLLILGTLPVQRTQAVIIPQEVDNTLDDFKAGTFQRSSLGTTQIKTPPAGPQPAVGDQLGAVQLIPIGLLKNWFNSPFLLPEPLTNIGAAAIGNHIFVVGGNTTVGNGQEPTDKVWSVTINPATGAPIETQTSWFDERDLPATEAQSTRTAAARAFSAVTSVQTGPDSGYLIVLGGSVKFGLSISSYGVSIGKVEGGHITQWTTSDGSTQLQGMRIPPDPIWLANGVQAASALSFKIGTKHYIYLFGGSQRFFEGAGVKEVGSKNVFYAEFNTSTGLLVKPSNPSVTGWDKLADIPLPASIDEEGGLWDATVMANHFDIGGGSLGGDVLYLMGGQLTTDPTYNSKVYRALINSNGTLTWTSTAGSQFWEGTLPEPRIGMAGVEYNGNLYVTGGRPSGAQPQKAVLTSYVEDDLTLPDIGDQGSNFLRNADVLLKARAHHASVVIPATPTVDAPNAAYVYVIAGEGDSSENDPDKGDDLGSRTLIYGKIGSSEDRTDTGFAPSGWFYSKAHDINISDAEVQKVNWTTVITRPGMDIQMEYRLSVPPSGDCASASAFNGSTWLPLDGSPNDSFHSLNSANSMLLPTGSKARCFQYRARLTTTNRTSTPSLLNVSILIIIPGSPDLQIKQLVDLRGADGKTLTGLKVLIINHNDNSKPTQPADIESTGSFFVDLCVYGPNDSSRVPPVLPLSDGNTQCSDLYAQITKSTMGPETTLLITQWCDSRSQSTTCTSRNPLSLFTKPGDYTLYAAVDSYDYVNEDPDNPAERNNVSAALTVKIHADPLDPEKPLVGQEIRLSIIKR